jgi:hypothetical protein
LSSKSKKKSNWGMRMNETGALDWSNEYFLEKRETSAFCWIKISQFYTSQHQQRSHYTQPDHRTGTIQR